VIGLLIVAIVVAIVTAAVLDTYHRREN